MEKQMKIDPRIKLLILPIICFLSFFINKTIFLLPMLVFACALFSFSHMIRRGLAYLLFFGAILLIEGVSTYFSNQSLIFAIYMVIYFISRMTLIAMFGDYITKTTTISEMIEALNKMKTPRSVSIPFSVLLRFAPTMRHEIKALHENMRIRGVISGRLYALLHPVKCVEYTLVPLLMRAIKISDELSTSAIIRGLDSEEKRITLVELKFHYIDLTVVLMGVITGLAVIILQNNL